MSFQFEQQGPETAAQPPNRIGTKYYSMLLTTTVDTSGTSSNYYSRERTRISSMNNNNTLGNVVIMIDQCKENGELKEKEDSQNLFILFGDRA